MSGPKQPPHTLAATAIADLLKTAGGKQIEFYYVNHRGERGFRYVRWASLIHGATGWHPEPQWLLAALDIMHDEIRLFAVEKIEIDTLKLDDPWSKTGPRGEPEIYSFPNWAEDDDGFDQETGAPGIGHFGRAVQLWSWTQNRTYVTVAEAAAVFNVDPLRVAQAVEDHPWMFIGKNGAGDDTIEHEGE